MTVADRARSAAYAVLEAVTPRSGVARRINGEVIRFPPRYARYYPRTYQPRTYRVLRDHCRPGSTAIDVGAHLGVFSVPLARHVWPEGKVICFEPTPGTREVLMRIIECNGIEAVVDVRPQAVSDAVGSTVLHVVTSPVGNANSLARLAGAESITVPTVTVDAAVGNSADVSCMKVDAEGGELAVLRGATGTILRCRPAIALDVHPSQLTELGGSLEALWSTIAELGYSVWGAMGLVSRTEFVRADGLFDVALLQAASDE